MPESKSPTPGEITIMAGGVVALIFSFFRFYSLPSASIAGRSFGGGGVSAWSSGLFPVATVMVILAVISAVVVALKKFTSVSLPDRVMGFTWEQIHLVLGFFAALYAVAFLLVDKGGYDFGIGFWFVLIGCIASLVGAILLLRERTGSSSPPPMA